MKITSVNNEIVKETSKLLQKKYREELKLFLLEGDKCIDEAIASNIDIIRVFKLNNYEKKFTDDDIEVTDAILSKISSTSTPPKAIAVAKQPQQIWSKQYKKIILLENIKDAGNLGTILRTAAGFNIDAVILYGDTVDLYNPKCVRSAVGNLWKVPVYNISDYNELKSKFGTYERVATLPKSEQSVWLKDYKPKEKILAMFGSEADGLSDVLKNFATKNVTIEMSKNVESLNLSVSAGIFMYKLF